MDNYINSTFESENINHLEPSTLKMPGANSKPVKLYKYVGVTTGPEWEQVKDYFVYITPEFVLRNGVTGFNDYGDIAWYCKHKDLFIVEQKLEVPLYLTVGYRERIKRTEAGEWYDEMVSQHNQQIEKIREIKSWFTEAVYPESIHDYIGDIISSSRVYVPNNENFFEEGSICFLIREEQDIIGMFVNLEYTKGLGNCRGVLDGIFCYLEFDPELADLINDWCIDETDDFRTLFVKEREHYVYKHHPKMCHHCHEFHSGCTKKPPKKPCQKHKKPWEYDGCHY